MTTPEPTPIVEVDPVAFEEPELDVEAHLICAALWTRARDTLAAITAELVADDFANATYGYLWTLITAAVTAGAPTDPASILTAADRAASHPAARGALLTIATLGADAASLRHFAADVASAAYRRGFHRTAATLAAAAERAAEHELMDILVAEGRRQRANTARLERLYANTHH